VPITNVEGADCPATTVMVKEMLAVCAVALESTTEALKV
jgi:hypothetical protein